MTECITPFQKQDKITGKIMTVACGKCPNCRKRRTSAWAFRLQQEEKRSVSSHFVTLTYATATVPITENANLSLKKSDLQDFFKRLRKLHTAKLKYYAVGEYGGQTKRPHYHLILFNAELLKVEQEWWHGTITGGTVTGASIAYTLKYISKNPTVPAFDSDDREREFGLMSKGLGDNYLTPQMKKWHHADPYNRMYCNLTDGKKIAMPRYYKEKIYNDHRRKAIGLQSAKEKELQVQKSRDKNPNYSRDLFEAHKQQFKKQAEESAKIDKL